jgi:hypothetical protein
MQLCCLKSTRGKQLNQLSGFVLSLYLKQYVMKVTLDIDDSKAAFLLELLSSLDYVTIDTDTQFEVPEWHKEIVRQRIKDATPNDYITWDEMKKKIKLK